MPPEIRTETWRGCASMKIGRERMTTEREVTIVTDMRETAWGVFDFGMTTLGPVRWVKTDG